MSEMLLAIHSWNRWLVVVAALLTFLFAIFAIKDTRKVSLLKKFSALHVIVVDMQVTVGLALYFFFSPIVQSAFQTGAGMMREPSLRYWAVEHIATMLLATILVHVGRTYAKKSKTENSFAKRTLLFTGLWIVLTLAAMPWPQLANGRPLFRWF